MEKTPIGIWYLPTSHGDIKLTRTKEGTVLRSYNLTSTERAALSMLRDKALKKPLRGQPWATPESFPEPGHASYRSSDGVQVLLRTKIDTVAALLAKGLKADRETLSVRRVGGKIEEILLQASEGDGVEAAPVETAPTPAPPPAAPPPPAELPRAATVAKPTVGCPMPDFGAADVRASVVLEAFLEPDQIADYRAHGCFVSVGADTGRRYMVIHRQVPTSLSRYGGRQLYDLEEKQPLCVHDWTVPAPEEMLALHLMLSVPGQERYLRHLPELFA